MKTVHFARLAALLALSLTANPAWGQGNIATVTGTGLSMDLQPANAFFAGYSLEVLFTTYDPNVTVPHYDEVNGLITVSSELSPVANQPGKYTSAYGELEDSTLVAYGYITASFPTTDSDGNGVPDFLQLNLNGDAAFSGTVVQQQPSSTVETYSGQINRNAGSLSGSYTAVVNDPAGQIIYSGEAFVLNATGQFSYSRGAQNTGTFSVSVSQPDGSILSWTAPTSFTVNSTEQLSFPQTTFTTAGNQSIVAQPFTLTRSGVHYRGTVTFNTADLSVSWPAYRTWALDISDANDAGPSGIPALSAAISAPSITSQPQSVVVAAGRSASDLTSPN